MQQDVVTVGADLAKNVLQFHAIGADDRCWSAGSSGEARC